MSDPINRQDAIDAINNVLADYVPILVGKTEEIPLRCASAISHLPSADACENACEITRKSNANDTISRQDALDALEWKWAGKAAFDAIKALPSAQRKAEWMHYGTKWEYRFTCSMCNYHLTGHKTNFCPNCGAKMEESE